MSFLHQLWQISEHFEAQKRLVTFAVHAEAPETVRDFFQKKVKLWQKAKQANLPFLPSITVDDANKPTSMQIEQLTAPTIQGLLNQRHEEWVTGKTTVNVATGAEHVDERDGLELIKAVVELMLALEVCWENIPQEERACWPVTPVNLHWDRKEKQLFLWPWARWQQKFGSDEIPPPQLIDWGGGPYWQLGILNTVQSVASLLYAYLTPKMTLSLGEYQPAFWLNRWVNPTHYMSEAIGLFLKKYLEPSGHRYRWQNMLTDINQLLTYWDMSLNTLQREIELLSRINSEETAQTKVHNYYQLDCLWGVFFAKAQNDSTISIKTLVHLGEIIAAYKKEPIKLEKVGHQYYKAGVYTEAMRQWQQLLTAVPTHSILRWIMVFELRQQVPPELYAPVQFMIEDQVNGIIITLEAHNWHKAKHKIEQVKTHFELKVAILEHWADECEAHIAYQEAVYHETFIFYQLKEGEDNRRNSWQIAKEKYEKVWTFFQSIADLPYYQAYLSSQFGWDTLPKQITICQQKIEVWEAINMVLRTDFKKGKQLWQAIISQHQADLHFLTHIRSILLDKEIEDWQQKQELIAITICWGWLTTKELLQLDTWWQEIKMLLANNKERETQRQALTNQMTNNWENIQNVVINWHPEQVFTYIEKYHRLLPTDWDHLLEEKLMERKQMLDWLQSSEIIQLQKMRQRVSNREQIEVNGLVYVHGYSLENWQKEYKKYILDLQTVGQYKLVQTYIKFTHQASLPILAVNNKERRDFLLALEKLAQENQILIDLMYKFEDLQRLIIQESFAEAQELYDKLVATAEDSRISERKSVYWRRKMKAVEKILEFEAEWRKTSHLKRLQIIARDKVFNRG